MANAAFVVVRNMALAVIAAAAPLARHLTLIARSKRAPTRLHRKQGAKTFHVKHPRVSRGRAAFRNFVESVVPLAAADGTRRAGKSRRRRGSRCGLRSKQLRARVRELERLFGKKTLEAEILKEALLTRRESARTSIR